MVVSDPLDRPSEMYLRMRGTSASGEEVSHLIQMIPTFIEGQAEVTISCTYERTPVSSTIWGVE